MVNFLFIVVISVVLGALFIWSFNSLQKEKWQIIGTIPHHKNADGAWQGTNFTYYGFFTSVAGVFACGIGLILFASQSIELTTLMILTVAILVPCFAAAKIVAHMVEKKEATLSIGGASFIGILFCPWLFVAAKEYFGLNLHVVSGLSILSIAYTFGESIGRLACISFGCCYGKRVRDLPPWLGKIVKRFSFVFSGDLKKITYAHHMDGEAVIPIQGITSVIYATTGLVGIYLFVNGHHTAAFLLTMIVTQVWRLISEFLRADYRGGGKISAYQMMGAFSVVYVIFIALLFPINNISTFDVTVGLKLFWNPGVIIFLEVLGLFIFIFTGRSQVTGATMKFNVHTHKI